MALPRFLKPVLGLLTILVLNVLSGTAFAAPQAGSTAVAPRIVTAVDETKLVTLAGSTHRLAVPQYDQGAVARQHAHGAHVVATAAERRAGNGFAAYD